MGNVWCTPIPNYILEEKIESYLYNKKIIYAAIFHYGIATAMEIKSMLNLKVADVRGRDGIVIPDFSRNIPEYPVRYDKRTLRIIQTLCDSKDDQDFLFSETAHGVPPTQTSIAFNIKNAGKAYGIEGLSFASLRKTHFYHIYQTYGIKEVTRLLGHKSQNETRRYLGIGSPGGCTECEERAFLLRNHYGKEHIHDIAATLAGIESIMESPSSPDTLYTDLVKDIDSMERLLAPYKNYLDTLPITGNPE